MSDKKQNQINLQELIDSISYIGDSTILNDDGKIYYSKVDGSYLTRVGMEDEIKFLLKFGITEQIQDGYGEPTTCCIGFNPIGQKWFGWSHRAIFGFGIGQTIKQGDCGFEASSKEEWIKVAMAFWGDCEYALNGVTEYIEKKDGITIYYTYNDLVPNESLRGTKYERFIKFPKKYGRGEWTAQTLEDCKQMAINFAKSVS